MVKGKKEAATAPPEVRIVALGWNDQPQSEKALNELGAAGWRVTAVTPRICSSHHRWLVIALIRTGGRWAYRLVPLPDEGSTSFDLPRTDGLLAGAVADGWRVIGLAGGPLWSGGCQTMVILEREGE